MKALIVGAGLSGVVSAILLKEKGYKVEILESRNHIGGNCYDSNLCGTLIHNYGPHIFHTDDEEVFSFLSRYTEWIPFKYQPKGDTELGLISLPYSKKTIKELGRELSNEEIIRYIFKDYSEKQWGIKFEEIPTSIISRIPKVNQEDDPTWFGDQKYQCLPKQGYTKMFENMLEGITYNVGASVDDWRKQKYDLLVYTGSIDTFFNNAYGELSYRTLDFHHMVTKDKLPYLVINQNNKRNAYTRIYDHSYFAESHKGLTVITKEFPREFTSNDIPFYPKLVQSQIIKYNKYRDLAASMRDTIFLGRLANYKYMDMWVSIKNVLNKLRDV